MQIKGMGEIDILIEDDRWSGIAAIEDRVMVAVRAALADSANRAGDRAGLSVLLADDETLRRLNADFRGKDKPTNVLSFPAASHASSGDAPAHIGDIALAFETCAREAKEEGKPVADHMTHLVVHGVLHLLGYDHETDQDAGAMEAREIAILAALGITDPYQDVQGEPEEHGGVRE